MDIKQHRKNKIIILTLVVILIFGFGFYDKVKAEGSSIYISPTNLSKTVGNIFDISVKVDPSGQKVCVVEGKLALNKLSCQKITMGGAISAQTSPSCDDLSFLLGIQGCTTQDKTLFTVAVKAKSSGAATANFSGVDIIGEGVSISSASSGGTYTLIVYEEEVIPEEEEIITPEEEEMPEGEEEEEEIIIIPEEEETQSFLLAAVSNIITFGTDNVWIAIIVAIVILAIIVYLVFYFSKKARRKKLG